MTATQTRFESTTQPGLFYWVETTDPMGMFGGPPSYMVVAQAEGFPASEAHDDWFGRECDALAVAELLAKGEL